MNLPFLIFALILQFAVSYAQISLDGNAEELGVAVEVLVVIIIVLCCCTCCAVALIVVYCCGGCSGRKEDNIIHHQGHSDGTEQFLSPTFAVSSVNPKMNIEKEKKILSASTNARTVSPDNLANDLSYNDKSLNRLKVQKDDVSELDKLEKASSVSKNTGSILTKVTLPNRGKNNDSSFGRLDKNSQERVRSVKLLAAQGGLVPIRPVYNDESSEVTSNVTTGSGKKRLYSTKFQEPPVPVEQPLQSSGKKDPEAIRRKVERIAKGAGGGVYNTGSSTARLSMDIVKGFDLMREKKKMEAEIAEKKRLEKLEQQEASKPKVKPPPPASPPPKQQEEELPEGKSKLMRFMEDLNDDEF